MDNYEDKSDFEINKAVAEALGNKHHWEEGCYSVVFGPSVKLCLCCPHPSFKLYDYCNNPSDAWPIITENKIGTRWLSDIWKAKGNRLPAQFTYTHENPLRAAMIVFLKMQEEI